MKHQKRIPRLLIIGVLLLTVSLHASSDRILKAILARAGTVHDEGELPVCIFDLDGTLFLTGFRSKQIFLEYALDTGDSTLLARITAMEPRTMKYRVRKSLIESGITDSTLLAAMLEKWRAKFFSDEYLQYDEHASGSVKFVNALHDSGALIIYLTGRDAPGTLVGTTAALQKAGFPVGTGRVELIMKPEPFMNTLLFKKQTLSSIAKRGVVIAIFENEPENLNLLNEYFPHAFCCFLKTQHKPNAPAPTENAHHLDDFLVNFPLKAEEGVMQETE